MKAYVLGMLFKIKVPWPRLQRLFRQAGGRAWKSVFFTFFFLYVILK